MLSFEEYLTMIRPYLKDITDEYKTYRERKTHSGNAVIDYKTHRGWKIQLIMVINFISSVDPNEIRTMRTMSNNMEIMMGNEQVKLLKNFLNLFCKNMKKK